MKLLMKFGITSWELTHPCKKALLKMIFLFPRWDMDSFPGGYSNTLPSAMGDLPTVQFVGVIVGDFWEVTPQIGV